ncbi:hypothetical protein VTL71DRAFT_15750, partial [Oculimacula yallundae]
MMKLFILFSLLTIVLAFPDLSSVKIWLASLQQPILDIIDNPRRTSTIPQFIVRAQHPWILANQRKLEVLPNAEAFLCLGPTDPKADKNAAQTADLQIPSDLFQNLSIITHQYDDSRLGWPDALERLTEIIRCPRALTEVKNLEVNVHVRRREYDGLLGKAIEGHEPPEKVMSLFGDVLEAMTRLETLIWEIGREDAPFLEQSFRARNLSLPSVTFLQPGILSHYMIGMCPNLETLENGGGYDWNGWTGDGPDWRMLFIESAASAPKLKRFAMQGKYEGWSLEYAAGVAKSVPQIESIGLRGAIRRRDPSENNNMLKSIVETFASLQNLSHIEIPWHGGLGLGFDGGAWCGNAYDGPRGEAYGREVAIQGAETTEKAAAILMTALPQLTSFSIGDDRPNVTRAENGSVIITWPWTGRMRDWVFEIWPPNPEFETIEYGRMRDQYGGSPATEDEIKLGHF